MPPQYFTVTITLKCTLLLLDGVSYGLLLRLLMKDHKYLSFLEH